MHGKEMQALQQQEKPELLNLHFHECGCLVKQFWNQSSKHQRITEIIEPSQIWSIKTSKKFQMRHKGRHVRIREVTLHVLSHAETRETDRIFDYPLSRECCLCDVFEHMK